jgi:hypothetical protein
VLHYSLPLSLSVYIYKVKVLGYKQAGGVGGDVMGGGPLFFYFRNKFFLITDLKNFCLMFFLFFI